MVGPRDVEITNADKGLVLVSPGATRMRITAANDGSLLVNGVPPPLAYTTGGWVAPTLTNSWADYGGSNRVCEYRKMPDGTIMVRGQVRSGTTNAAIFTLPTGCRPTYAENFLCMAYLTAPALVNVGTDGVVKVIRYGTGGDNTYVSLAGIRFSYID